MVTEKKAPAKSDKQDRIIALITGDSGTGKSFFIGSLKKALIYDTDLGGGLAYLDERITKNGSERVELSSYKDIIADLRKRLSAGNLYETIVIDHVTQLQQEAILRHNPHQEADFGRGGNKATYEWRQLREFVRTFDCNLFCVAHLKAEFEKDKNVGKMTDAAKNIDGDMHVVLRLEAKKDDKGRKQYPSEAIVVKWRRDPEDKRGAVPDAFTFTLDNFEKLHGLDYKRERDKVELAKDESVVKLRSSLEKVGEERRLELTDKWLKAAGVEGFGHMTEPQVQACIGLVLKELEAK